MIVADWSLTTAEWSWIRRAKRYALAHPWPGNMPLRPTRFNTLDTDALLEPGRPTRVLCTFDVGYAASGWFKNAEWEQCLHVSVSHSRPDRGQPEACSDAEMRAWADAFFGPHAHMVWLEPAVGPLDPHRMAGVAHLRLYYDQHRQPFLPTGEPYTLRLLHGISPAKVVLG